MAGGLAPLAQLDRASGYEPEGREFESLRAHHFFTQLRAIFDPSLWGETRFTATGGDEAETHLFSGENAGTPGPHEPDHNCQSLSHRRDPSRTE
jgi:hypothetical protein